ncbi:MAG: choice-of-anchor I family protein [Pegethrix bostrychoides GSE-TBD4-15B]|jgi:YVTN family beta-propeller protein|uniref:Choice-of-anchor I family protein n=1 Tax=Pegethrix bostrychoides GSE-TBD4-15B TaxID=2839662 RepID=A0A951U753_9CYAN|nr:choice-of-anchor I family protein [Pegethrix bostrychoides GSE-TBD4-15B]
MTAFSPIDPNSNSAINLDASPGFLKKIGGFAGEGAEISAYDPTTQRLFVISGGTELQVLDLSDPSQPQLVSTLDVMLYGGGANSVAISNGIVAVAVQADPATDPGKVVFFDIDGMFQAEVEVGALPDMLTFTPDGTKVLVANEAEPSSYNQPDSIDPVGSISIIDLTHGVTQATVATAGFESFNPQKAELQARGVRVFGPNASVEQDLEPEYITVSADGKTAYVTLQENNALAVVDVTTATVAAIVPLGLKDFSKGLPTLTSYDFTDRPALGTTAAGQTIQLGGFSGLFYEGKAENGNLKFVTNTDRGPNGEPTDLNASNPGNERPFALPDFQPEIVRFELNPATGQISITQQIKLTQADGTPITGLPNLQSGAAGTAYTDEVAVDLEGNLLPNDPLGADTEGIVVAPDGSFWLVDEYRPAIYHVAADGKLIERFIPEGAPTEGGEFGTPALPAVYAQRRSNRGFEAVALEGTKLYAFIQSPIDHPDSAADTVSRSSRNLRILEFDTVSKQTTGEYLYILDDVTASGNAKTDKIGDAVSLGNGKFLVAERDDLSSTSSNKLIYEIDLQGATNLHQLDSLTSGKTIEQLSVAELAAAQIEPVSKRLVTNAAAIGYTGVEKLEGLAVVDEHTIALINDNDFGIAGSTINSDGTLSSIEDTPVKLGLINFNQSNGLDASDRDGENDEGAIKIQFEPVLGLYQPDAIASFSINGQTYLVTANEGDTRDYDGFNEEIRVGDDDYQLDPTRFPNAEALKDDANLGRLTVTTADGDLDGDGDYDQIVVPGARSFSVWDSSGNLIFDSGDQLEQITAQAVPNLFNSNGTAETFDSRSDNKGPEPEGVVIGTVNNRVYAFIGLERTGGVIVYEVTDPNQPQFVEYVSTEGDISPEGLTFIPASQNPNGKSLLVVSNEVSGTVGIFEFTPPTRISDIQGAGHVSPLVDQTVNVAGIVTAVTSIGFYIQDPHPDSNPDTSEGIFVFRGSAGSKPTLGDSVRVNGTVSEFRGSPARSNDLSVTQITATGATSGFTVLSSGNALPAATIIGADGRMPPNQVIANDAVNGSVEGSPFDPAEDGIDFYESLEGMYVQVNNAVAVGPTSGFGEIPVVADSGADAGARTARGGLYIQPTDFNPERIIIDDVIVGDEPDVNVGDIFTSPIVGLLDYSFSNFKLLNTEVLQVELGDLEREVTALVGTENQLTVASFNVENLDPKKEDRAKVSGQSSSNVDDDLGDGKFDALAERIVDNLKSPDIISLEEVQDNTGAEIGDGVVDATVTYELLIDAIQNAGGPTYEFRSVNPAEGEDGGQPGGNIRVGFLFNPERVSFVERPGGSATTNTTVVDGAPSASPGRLLDPDLTDGDAFANSRKPLVGEFEFQGNRVIVVGNHFNSKGGDQPLFGRFQPPTLTSETQRSQQAQIVRQFVDDLLGADPNANVIVAGDLNDFQFSNPLDILTQGGALSNLYDLLPAAEQYSYNFEGNAQVLDHILVSPNLQPLAEFDVVHINSEFARQDSDHDPLVARFRFEMAMTQVQPAGF